MPQGQHVLCMWLLISLFTLRIWRQEQAKSRWVAHLSSFVDCTDFNTAAMLCAVCVKSLSLVWLCDPMDCSPPGSSVHRDSPGKNTGVKVYKQYMLGREWRKGDPLTLLVGMQTIQPLWRTVWRFLKKLEIELPCDSAIPLLGIHTEETRSERDTCTPMFIAALFIIARTWKQPRCPSADKWLRKLWYIYTMEYYSAIKKNSFESVLMTWMKLEPIIQSEVSQKDKDHYSILTHIYGI